MLKILFVLFDFQFRINNQHYGNVNRNFKNTYQYENF